MSRTYDTPIGKVPSVTTILSVIMKNLVDWASNLQHTACIDKAWVAIEGIQSFEDKRHFTDYMDEVKGSHKTASKEAMSLGSLVHSMVDCWNIGLFDGSPDDYMFFLSDYYPTDSIKMLGAYFKAIKDNNIEILKSELTVYHPDGFAGTLDALVKFDDAELIMDIKTGGVYWTYWLQLEAYRQAYSWMFKKEPVGRMIIRLDKDEPGRYEILVRPLTINTEIRIWQDRRKKKNYQRDINHFPCDHVKDYQAFLAAKIIFERSQNK